MTMNDNPIGFASALGDFHEARRRAALEAVTARLTGKSVDLFAYEEVRQKLKARGSSALRGLQDIPLDAIVGSVGRYNDFTRHFLPRRDSDQHRWARVKAQVTNMGGLPPIEVYQIGEAYFVRDGNHRVSVARELGTPSIQAYVTEVRTKVPLSPDDQPDDLILKAEYADFLDNTRLDRLRPEADLSVTVPGQYQAIEEHIAVHRYFMGLEQQREISYEEAVAHWYDAVYLPVVQVIQEQGILRDFPERTDTDMYLWVSEHRAALEERLGWEIRPEAAAIDLAVQSSSRPDRIAARVGERLLEMVTPTELGDGPSPGEWRREHVTRYPGGHLFTDILVPLSGGETSWHALDQSLGIAQRESGRLRGLHVVPTEEQKDSPEAQAVQAEFNRRCEAAGVPGQLAIEAGGIARKICERTRWTDLIVVDLNYPPPSEPVAKLGSGFRTLIRRCASPVLAVPEAPSPLDHLLLAYDGSPKADEALFVATYLTDRWQTSLAVVTATENGQVSPETLTRAQKYLESHAVQATYLEGSGPVSDAILKTAEEQGSNLIILGGYGHGPVLEIVLGSTVDQVLRACQQPVLICR
jgi:nucleotide-binding universal stress UspA family protein